MKTKANQMLVATLLSASLVLAACTSQAEQTSASTTSSVATQTSSASSSASTNTSTASVNETYFSNRDVEVGYDESTATSISLSGSSATVTGQGASVSDSVITISTEGTYILSGTGQNVQVVVNVADTQKVQLVLNNVTITSTDAAIVVEEADKVFITMAEGSTNTLQDSANPSNQETKAVIFSRSDLTLNGNGTLNIIGNFNNGIESNDDLKITSGTYTIKAANHTLSANDALNIMNANLNLDATEDAIHSDNEEDTSLGNIYLKDATITIAAGDDAVHASNALLIDGKSLSITKSNEGLEAKTMVINSGDISIVSSDDAINGSDGSSSSAMGMMGSATSGVSVTINGGTITIDAQGDGLDSNGDLLITGGQVYVNGPTNDGNGALDYDGSGSISGGTVIIVGSAGMAMGFDNNSSQASVFATITGNAGSQVSVTDASGKELASYTTTKAFQTVLASSPEMVAGQTYTITVNGQATTVTAALSTGNGGHMGGGMPGQGGGRGF